MRQRYKIYETYNGLCDTKNVLCITDSLFHAVHIIELFKKSTEDNPCYDYDFLKIAQDVDEALDFYPGTCLFDEGFIIDCKNYQDYLNQIKGVNND